jgi:uncharacterized protein (TIGR02421 family)
VRALRLGFSRAVRHTIYHFVRQQTKQRPTDFYVFGRRTVVKAVWEVDAQLDEISTSFDFLLSLNPTNIAALWTDFRRSNYENLAPLRYRPIPVDVSLTKRRLFEIPIERVEDPTLARLFREKQDELDRQLTMLRDRGTPRFMLGGLQIYGAITPSLVRSAEELLERVPGSARVAGQGRLLKPEEFKRLAEEEIAFYRGVWEGVQARVRLSPDVMAGLMAARGNLLVASDVRMPEARADALIQHEIGTHLVTYYNGLGQRLTQLRTGFAGYEELQEGLAVFAEYAVGGLTPERARTLAGRVIAAKALVEGATFVDTFRLLCRVGFPPKPAFNIVLRIHRGGGLIKDCIYLRGVQSVFDYLRDGGDLERLFVGKIALHHLSVIHELEARQVLAPMRLRPRYMDRPEFARRVETLRRGRRLYELVQMNA